MLKPKRHALIQHRANLHNNVLSTNLGDWLQVSENTICRDLMKFSQGGKVIRSHGGALSGSFHQHVIAYVAESKRAIAAKALTLLQDGMQTFAFVGTTILELARMLPENLHATFVSGSLPAALAYRYRSNIAVILPGGRGCRHSSITIGGTAISAIRQINADLCLVGVNTNNPQAGITDNDWEVVEVKCAMIQQAKKTAAPSISERINDKDQIPICDTANIDVLITGLHPDDEKLDAYKTKGVQLL